MSPVYVEISSSSVPKKIESLKENGGTILEICQ
jgi:biotin operon repressor